MPDSPSIKSPSSDHSPSPVLTVPDLDEALAFFTERLGFRVEMIVPADAPRTAIISGQGVTLRLELAGAQASRTNPLSDVANDAPPFIISRLSDEAWHTGRAGMQYRDLIPGRLGGRFIASHIRIPDGGDVPDYVHYHHVRFQMIYCKAGWVRVVYEDQGAPFMLEAGDCVLQPPQIRHRVLEASPGLEVIEIGCPAVHETWADHELTLPTTQLRPERLFNGQRFVRHLARQAEWTHWWLDDFIARDTGIAAATNGLAAVRVVKASAATTALVNEYASEFLFVFILKGELKIESVAQGSNQLQAGDSCAIPPGVAFTLRSDAELEFLEVSLPAKLPLAKAE